MKAALALRNVGFKAGRRLLQLRKPFVRWSRRQERVSAYFAARREEARVERELAAVVDGDEPLIVGPWLAEVGYEALYWIPFLRWVTHTYRIRPERVIAVSRGGVADWYGGVAGAYVDLFDELTPEAFAAKNDARRTEREGGGQKQTTLSAFDHELVERVRQRRSLGTVRVCHPSLMFRLFREFWLGNQSLDFLWRRTRYQCLTTAATAGLDLPDSYTAVKFYSGAAMPLTPSNRAALRATVSALANVRPVILLDTGLRVDEHEDYVFDGIRNVVSLRAAMTPATNLGIQTAVVAGARQFVGTCGGLTWLAPLLRVPTVAVYSDDKLLTTHLTVARHAYRESGAASFSPLDLRAVERSRLVE